MIKVIISNNPPFFSFPDELGEGPARAINS